MPVCERMCVFGAHVCIHTHVNTCYFPPCYDKMSGEELEEGEGLLQLAVEGCTSPWREAQQQDFQAATHITSAVRDREMDAGPQTTLLLFPRSPAQAAGYTHLQWPGPVNLTNLELPHRHAQALSPR